MLKAKEAIDILKTARNTMSKKNKRLKNFFLAFYFFFKIGQNLPNWSCFGKQKESVLSILSSFFEKENAKFYHK